MNQLSLLDSGARVGATDSSPGPAAQSDGAVPSATSSVQASSPLPVQRRGTPYSPNTRLFYALKLRLLDQKTEPAAGRETMRWFKFRAKLWRIGHQLWPDSADFERHCQGLLRGQVPWRES